jgi:hypothetical protein
MVGGGVHLELKVKIWFDVATGSDLVLPLGLDCRRLMSVLGRSLGAAATPHGRGRGHRAGSRRRESIPPLDAAVPGACCLTSLPVAGTCAGGLPRQGTRTVAPVACAFGTRGKRPEDTHDSCKD